MSQISYSFLIKLSLLRILCTFMSYILLDLPVNFFKTTQIDLDLLPVTITLF